MGGLTKPDAAVFMAHNLGHDIRAQGTIPFGNSLKNSPLFLLTGLVFGPGMTFLLEVECQCRRHQLMRH
jgi:hypothetical protein